MKELYQGENKGKYTKTMLLTPDRITKMGVARTFQNIRLFKDLTVFENVLIAKHMNIKANIFSATFRLNRKEEQQMREESMELLRILGLEKNKDDIASSLPTASRDILKSLRAFGHQALSAALDEPAAGMNPQESDDLMHFIRQDPGRF
jgi:branched-chain amino acid transport system ATP-binding protein